MDTAALPCLKPAQRTLAHKKDHSWPQASINCRPRSTSVAAPTTCTCGTRRCRRFRYRIRFLSHPNKEINMIHLTYRQAFVLAVALFVVAALVCAPVAAVAGPILKGWAYSAHAPANPQLGDGWLPANHQTCATGTGRIGSRWAAAGTRSRPARKTTGPASTRSRRNGNAAGPRFCHVGRHARRHPVADGVIQEVGLWYSGAHLNSGPARRPPTWTVSRRTGLCPTVVSALLSRGRRTSSCTRTAPCPSRTTG